MTLVTKEFRCQFQTFRETMLYRYQDRPDGFWDPNTSFQTTTDVITLQGWVSCEDPTIVGQQAGDGIPGHYRRLHIPKFPANSTIISSECDWNVIAHAVGRSENVHPTNAGNYTLDHGVAMSALEFPQFTPSVSGSVVDYIMSSGNPGSHALRALTMYDGVQNYDGTSGITQVCRIPNFSGTVPLGAGPGSDGFTLDSWRTGWGLVPNIYIYPTIGFADPTRTFSGTANSLRNADYVWASGSFNLRVVYDI